MGVFYRNDDGGGYSKGHYTIKLERVTIDMPSIVSFVLILNILFT